MQTIYEPMGKAREYAPLALNLYESCPHGCRYCYAAGMAVRFGKAKSKAEWHGRATKARAGILQALERKAKQMQGEKLPILMCFTCDPYPPDEPVEDYTQDGYHCQHPYTRCAIMTLLENGLTPIILTKGGTRAVRDFDVLKAAGGWFGQTCSFTDTVSCREWEPGAAWLPNRWAALEDAKKMSVNTWVSVEPVISPSQALSAIALYANGQTDHFKLGKLSGYSAETSAIERSIDWPAYRKEARAILDAAGYREITEAGAVEVGTYYVKAELRDAV